ncbi:zinc finger BED domain-containing protein 4-like [Sitophilus oryzae]|uniref:Zinc finger BED domain-containing protein 4-like n=1 Tax=Sitophilus oryzae TaxID=7048 RepID=A0A6J2YMS4_SITOR|nr:zinc finger BED domain-containing protein 4-like [Sitophilus oryzae]
MIALADLPFSFVESLGFERLMKHLCPSYNLKSRQYYTTFICDKLYGKVSQKILELLKSFEKISFTSDIWSDSCSGVSLLSLTCHGITEEFERKMIVLKAEVFNDGRHTGENIMEKLEGILSTWEIPKEKVKCVVRDAGANMKKGVSLLNVEHIDCASHKIQNVLKEGMKAQETFITTITKCKKIATHFHHSNSAQDELSKLQKIFNQTPLKIIHECVTRWNSTFYMLQRILEVQEAVCLYASTTNNKIPQLTSEEWMIIKKLVGLLKPFEDITKELSSAKVSVSSVIPLIATLQKILDDFDSTDEHIGETINVLREELSHKFGFLENEILFVTATFIDPRYKIKFFRNNSIKDRVIQHILDLLGDSETSAPLSSRNAKRARLNETENSTTYKRVSFRETMESLMDDTSDSEEDDVDDKMTRILFIF